MLVSCIGLQLFAAPKHSRPLVVSSALGLAGIDIVPVAKGVIAPVYLADAAVEIAMALLWSGTSPRDGERVPADLATDHPARDVFICDMLALQKGLLAANAL